MEKLARLIAVRLLRANFSGSGAIGQLSRDGLGHQPLGVARRLDDVWFHSAIEYKVTLISGRSAAVGEPLLVAGFPAGARVVAVARGGVELLLSKSLPQAHSLGYTNEVKIGMSGGPIFNTKGFLVGINGGSKYRTPDLDIYTFEDGSKRRQNY